MKVKDLLALFTADTSYTIKFCDNPHLTVWFGRGNKVNTCCNDYIIKAIQSHKGKIIIYI